MFGSSMCPCVLILCQPSGACAALFESETQQVRDVSSLVSWRGLCPKTSEFLSHTSGVLELMFWRFCLALCSSSPYLVLVTQGHGSSLALVPHLHLESPLDPLLPSQPLPSQLETPVTPLQRLFKTAVNPLTLN